MAESTLTEKIMESKNMEDFKNLLSDGRNSLLKDPNHIILPSHKPIVFVGDLHGDYQTLQKIISNYSNDNTLVFLGDYVDRAEDYFGSMHTSLFLIEQKVISPNSIFLLRGNHEFKHLNREYGLFNEIKDYAFKTKIDISELFYLFNDTFKAMSYVATTDNGVIALHGGIPNINNKNEIENLPKDVNDAKEISQHNGTRGQKQIISQIVWNDNELDPHEGNDLTSKTIQQYKDLLRSRYNEKGYTYNPRISYGTDIEMYAILYGESYFNEKMEIINKKVLVRGHDHKAKGYSLNDKILTVFSSSLYSSEGNMKGVYVAVLDPQREINNATDIRIDHIN